VTDLITENDAQSVDTAEVLPDDAEGVDTEAGEERPLTQIGRRTQRFRNQHDVLINMAVELQEISAVIPTVDDAKKVRDHLNRLAGKLVVHLAKEDKSLYPKLLESADAQVVSLTKRYITEMGDLASVFELYNKRWVTPLFIYKYQDKFQSETASIVKALAARIDKENNELYVLADALPNTD
jgi:hemerythrin-like domain-containing protein